MAPKHRLTIPDIEDEEDLQERRIARKIRKKNPVKLSFLDDDLDAPVMLHKKVKHVESRMDANRQDDVNGLITRAIENGPMKSDEDRQPEELENLPVIVESEELKSEALLDSIPRIMEKTRVLILKYEQLQLHQLFLSVEENCKFRLFLYVVAYGHTLFWPKDKLMPSVLRRILMTESVANMLKSKGFAGDAFSENRGKMHVQEMTVSEQHIELNYPVVRYREKIEVAARITRLLP